jgi:hypothetical protein
LEEYLCCYLTELQERKGKKEQINRNLKLLKEAMPFCGVSMDSFSSHGRVQTFDHRDR